MPGRNYQTDAYRYGFAGKEKDGDFNNNYDFGARIYDSRLGRWLSLDPLAKEYPSHSPYCYSLNTPIAAKDPDGKKVYIVVALTEMVEVEDKDGNFIGFVDSPSGKFMLIDVTSADDVTKLNDYDKKLYNLYSYAKKTEMGKEEFEKYEMSTDDDIYIFETNNEYTQAVMPGQVAMTQFDIQDENNNGKFNLAEVHPELYEPYELAIDNNYSKIEGLPLKNKDARNHFISYSRENLKNNELYNAAKDDPKASFKLSVIGLIHEVKSHITYSLQGLFNNKGQQHDKWYGKKGGNSEDYDPKSDHGTLINQVDEALNKK